LGSEPKVNIRAKLAEARLLVAAAAKFDATALVAAVEAALRFNASGPRVEAALAQVYIYI